MKRGKNLTEADVRALTALRRGAFVQTPEGLRCLPVEPTPAERARAIAEHEAWMGGGAVPAEEPTLPPEDRPPWEWQPEYGR